MNMYIKNTWEVWQVPAAHPHSMRVFRVCVLAIIITKFNRLSPGKGRFILENPAPNYTVEAFVWDKVRLHKPRLQKPARSDQRRGRRLLIPRAGFLRPWRWRGLAH